jgi:hypothetical protein
MMLSFTSAVLVHPQPLTHQVSAVWKRPLNYFIMESKQGRLGPVEH